MKLKRSHLILVGVLAGLAQQAHDPYMVSIATTMVAAAVLALAVYLHTMVAGLPTLGAAAWSATGAFAAVHLGAGILSLQIVVGAAAGLLLAAVTGLLVVRSSGLTTIMITLAVAEVVQVTAGHWKAITGGTDGLSISVPVLWPGQPPAADYELYTALLVTLGVVTAVLWIWLASPSGQALRAVADNRWRMQACGWNTTAHLYTMHLVAGTIGGIAGAMLLAARQYTSPADASLQISALVLAAAVIGANLELPGVIAAAVALVAVRDLASALLPGPWAGHSMILLAAVLLAASYLPTRTSNRRVRPVAVSKEY